MSQRLGLNLSSFDTGYDGGSSGSDSEGPNETLGGEGSLHVADPTWANTSTAFALRPPWALPA